MRSGPSRAPEQVLDYLGRYSHRVAPSNDRLVDHRDGHVRFRWKDYTDHDRVKILTLEADEFLRRFLLHVIPRGFMRIRHFGLLANRIRQSTLPAWSNLQGPRMSSRPMPCRRYSGSIITSGTVLNVDVRHRRVPGDDGTKKTSSSTGHSSKCSYANQ